MVRAAPLPWHATADAHIGSRLRHRRALLGMSQRTLAAAVGVTYQQVRKYELGINCISGGRLYTIAAALGVPVSFFFDGLPPTSVTTALPSSTATAAEAASAGKEPLDVLGTYGTLPHGVRRGRYPLPKATTKAREVEASWYRIYFLDTARRIDGIHWFGARDDATARSIADLLYQACSALYASFELREGSRILSAANGVPRPAETTEEVEAQSQEMLVRYEEVRQASALRVAKSRRLLEALQRGKKLERGGE